MGAGVPPFSSSSAAVVGRSINKGGKGMSISRGSYVVCFSRPLPLCSSRNEILNRSWIRDIDSKVWFVILKHRVRGYLNNVTGTSRYSNDFESAKKYAAYILKEYAG